jgi:hypothetical protein
MSFIAAGDAVSMSAATVPLMVSKKPRDLTARNGILQFASGQWRARRHGSPGTDGSPGNVESATYRI